MEINKPVSTIIMFIIILMLVFLFVIPRYQQSDELDQTLTQKEAEYNGESMYYNNISALLTQIQSQTDALQKIDSALPSNFSFAPIVYFLQKNTTQTGLILNSITFSGVSPSTTHKEVRDVTFTVNLQGDYQHLKNFLYALDTSARLFEVSAISLTPKTTTATKNQAPTYDFQLEIKTHTY